MAVEEEKNMAVEEEKNMAVEEEKIRKFLIDELMKEKVELSSNEDSLDLDSIEQVEMRIFIEEEFKVSLSEDFEGFNTINSILKVVSKKVFIDKEER